MLVPLLEAEVVVSRTNWPIYVGRLSFSKAKWRIEIGLYKYYSSKYPSFKDLMAVTAKLVL